MALRSIKVLDLTRLLPGPLCTHFLTRLGADVIKVESTEKSHMDYVRDLQPQISIDGKSHSSLFESLNAGKKSVCIDIRSTEGQGILKKLAKHTDVIVEGSRPGSLQKYGLDYASLSQINEKLIYCSLSGYGSYGPIKNVAGHDINYMALSGLLSLSGSKKSLPPTIGKVNNYSN